MYIVAERGWFSYNIQTFAIVKRTKYKICQTVPTKKTIKTNR